MKLTRFQFFAAAVPALLGSTAFAASAARRSTRKQVVNGIVTKVKSDTGIIEIRRSGRLGLEAVIVTDEDTKYLRSDEEEASFEDIVLGVKIQAKGRLNQDASIQAKRILIKVPDPKE
jgi:hypothetical protein